MLIVAIQPSTVFPHQYTSHASVMKRGGSRKEHQNLLWNEVQMKTIMIQPIIIISLHEAPC
jgi:hypothetical protein